MRLRPGNLEELEPASLRGLPAGVHLVERWNGEAAFLFEQGRHEEARSLYERALEVDPRDVESLHNLGWLHFVQGRHDEARSLYERALEVDPDDPETQSVLASLALYFDHPP